MPRAARLDIPDLLQHIMVRGIEKRDIFYDDTDRSAFLHSLDILLHETNTDGGAALSIQEKALIAEIVRKFARCWA